MSVDGVGGGFSIFPQHSFSKARTDDDSSTISKADAVAKNALPKSGESSGAISNKHKYTTFLGYSGERKPKGEQAHRAKQAEAMSYTSAKARDDFKDLFYRVSALEERFENLERSYEDLQRRRDYLLNERGGSSVLSSDISEASSLENKGAPFKERSRFLTGKLFKPTGLVEEIKEVSEIRRMNVTLERLRGIPDEYGQEQAILNILSGRQVDVNQSEESEYSSGDLRAVAEFVKDKEELQGFIKQHALESSGIKDRLDQQTDYTLKALKALLIEVAIDNDLSGIDDQVYEYKAARSEVLERVVPEITSQDLPESSRTTNKSVSNSASTGSVRNEGDDVEGSKKTDSSVSESSIIIDELDSLSKASTIPRGNEKASSDSAFPPLIPGSHNDQRNTVYDDDNDFNSVSESDAHKDPVTELGEQSSANVIADEGVASASKTSPISLKAYLGHGQDIGSGAVGGVVGFEKVVTKKRLFRKSEQVTELNTEKVRETVLPHYYITHRGEEPLSDEYIEQEKKKAERILNDTTIGKLSQSYSGLRQIGPDGNCYYRSVMYGYVEQLLLKENWDALNRLSQEVEEAIQTVKNKIDGNEDLANALISRIKKVDNKEQLKIFFEQKVEGFRDFLRGCNQRGAEDNLHLFQRKLKRREFDESLVYSTRLLAFSAALEELEAADPEDPINTQGVIKESTTYEKKNSRGQVVKGPGDRPVMKTINGKENVVALEVLTSGSYGPAMDVLNTRSVLERKLGVKTKILNDNGEEQQHRVVVDGDVPEVHVLLAGGHYTLLYPKV